MVAILTAGLLALALGLRHAVEPDHLAAVSTLVAEGRGGRGALWTGAFWGIGHSLALLAVGTGLLVLRTQMPNRLDELFEAFVAVMLIVLGARSLLRRPHAHAHAHPHRRRPLTIGLVHGLAGSGALTALALATMPTFAAGLWFMLWFGLGAMAGMALLAGVAGFALKRASHVQALIGPLAGILSLSLGAWKLVTYLK